MGIACIIALFVVIGIGLFISSVKEKHDDEHRLGGF